MAKKKQELEQFDEELATHCTNDPNVWGLLDVTVGRRPLVPTTIYRISGDSASGVVGLLLPSGEFRVAHSSRAGQFEMRIQDGGADDGQKMPDDRVLPTGGAIVNAPLPTELAIGTVWDGAKKEDPVLVTDEETGVTEERQGRSKGLLLGDYAVRVQVDRGADRNDKDRTFQQAGVVRTFPRPEVGKRKFVPEELGIDDGSAA